MFDHSKFNCLENMHPRNDALTIVLGDKSFVARLIRTCDCAHSFSFYSMRDESAWQDLCRKNLDMEIRVIWCIKTHPFWDELELLRRLLSFLRAETIKFKLVYLSSFAVYQGRSSISESPVVKATSDYAKAKMACESFLRQEVGQAVGLASITCLRLASFYDENYPGLGIAPYVRYVNRVAPTDDPAFVFEAYGVGDLIESIDLGLKQQIGCFRTYDVVRVLKWADQHSSKPSLASFFMWRVIVPVAWRFQELLPQRARFIIRLFARK